MNLTILGNCGAYPGEGAACSGYLLGNDDQNLLIDCGTGTLANLQAHVDLENVQEIIITHMHADHFFDLIPFRYALRYGLNSSKKPRLYLPPGGIEILNKVVAPFSESESFFAEVFQLSEYRLGDRLLLGNLAIDFVPVSHYIPTYGLSIAGSKKFGFSADSGYCQQLIQIARDTDLFLCNVGRCLSSEMASLWGHMLPEEAGKLAKEAAARRLVITHFWPKCNKALCLEKASITFGQPAELAEINRTFEF